MSILSPKPRKNPDGTVLYKGKIYASENDPNFIRIMSIEREQKDAANRANLQSLTNPNNITAGQVRLNAANELSALQNLQNARMNGMPVARNTNDIIMNNNPVANNTSMNLLGLNANTPNVNINANSLLPSQNVAQQNVNTQNQNSQNTSKTGGFRNFFNRANQSFQNAAPIFAVAQEFRKAGAPRTVGAPMQGDPYGAMIQMQQNRQQAENLANLRQDPQYAQFANLPDDLFIDAVKKQNDFVIKNQLAAQNTYANIKTNVSSDELVQQLNETKQPIILSEYEERAHGNTEMAHGWENTANLIAGSISVPFTSRNLAKRTEEARAATVQYFNYVRGILVDDVGGRVTVFDKKQVNNQLPATFDDKGTTVERFHSEGKALASYQGLKGQLTSQLRDAIALTQDPNTQDDKTVMRKANSKIDKLRKAIKLTDIRIASLNQERRGADEFYGEREDLFENPIDTSGYNGMTEEQAEEIFFSDLDVTFE